MRGRFTVRLSTLMALVAMLAVGVTALRFASDTWARAVFSAALLALGVGAHQLIARRGVGRAYWLGFCVLGWGYFVACFGPWCAEAVQPQLMTTWALERLAPWIVSPRVLTLMSRGRDPQRILESTLATPADLSDLTPGEVRVDQINGGWPGIVYRSVLSPGHPAHVLRIGHSLFALGFAMLGGWYARRRFEEQGGDRASARPG